MAEQRQKQEAEIQQCPLCLCTPGKSQRNFVAHVGKHMEAIALAALPRDDRSDSDSEVNSETSSVILMELKGTEMTNPDDTKITAKKDSKKLEVDENSDDDIDNNGPRYCYCNSVSYGEMIACDAENCKKEWFHLGCSGLKVAPKGDGELPSPTLYLIL